MKMAHRWFAWIVVIGTLAACASLPESNPSRFTSDQQDQVVHALKQVEYMVFLASTANIDIVSIRLTDDPQKEIWTVDGRGGELHEYTVTMFPDGHVGVTAEHLEQEWHF